jgi:hypothetical protein
MPGPLHATSCAVIAGVSPTLENLLMVTLALDLAGPRFTFVDGNGFYTLNGAQR